MGTSTAPSPHSTWLEVIAAALVVPFVALSIAILPHGPTTSADVEQADNYIERPLPHTVVNGPIRFRDGGYWLAAHSQGTIITRVSMRAPEGRDQALLFVSSNATPPVSTMFTVARDLRSAPRSLGAAGWSGLAQKLYVTDEAQHGPFNLGVTTTNGLDEPTLMLTRVVPATEPPVDLPSPHLVILWAAVGFLLGLTILQLAGLTIVPAVAILAILAEGFAQRARELATVVGTLMYPDAVAYRLLAERARHPYDTGNREPLWPLVTKGWLALFGPAAINLRVLTLILSLVLVAVVYRFASALVENRLVGLVAALLVAVHPALVASSVQGLREELYAVLLVLVAHVALIGSSSPRRRLGWLVALVAGLTLLRMTTLYFVPLMLLLGVRRGCVRLREVAISTGAAVVALVPYLVYSQRHFGDPLWASNIHGMWYRNVEFVLVKGRGCDGCPSVAHMLATYSFTGEKISNTQYIFGMHPFGTVVSETLRGMYELLLKPGTSVEALLGDDRLVLVYLAGLVSALVAAQWELLVILLLGINIAAFLGSVAPFDLRIVFHVIPFMMVITVLPLHVLLSLAKRRSSLPDLPRLLRLRAGR